MLRLLFALLLSASCLLAQSGAGTLRGVVKDPTGAVIPNASVALEQVRTSARQQTTANDSGLYVFPALQPGEYKLTASAPGLEQWQATFELQTGQQASIDPVLKVATSATEITVAGDVTPLVTTSSPTLANVLERQRIEQLPLKPILSESDCPDDSGGRRKQRESARVRPEFGDGLRPGWSAAERPQRRAHREPSPGHRHHSRVPRRDERSFRSLQPARQHDRLHTCRDQSVSWGSLLHGAQQRVRRRAPPPGLLYEGAATDSQ